MTKEQAAADIKEKLMGLTREQLLIFFAEMEDGDTQELQEEAVELINDIFGDNNQIESVEDVHADIVGIIEAAQEDDGGEEVEA